jgi:hypothetical protein
VVPTVHTLLGPYIVPSVRLVFLVTYSWLIIEILSASLLTFCFLIAYFQHLVLEDIQKNIRELEPDDNRKKELACVLHAQFKDWLYGNSFIY